VGAALTLTIHAQTPEGAAKHSSSLFSLSAEEITQAEAHGVTVSVAEQGYAVPTLNLSCHTRTPLKIGEKEYTKGVGTHSKGRFVFRLNEPFVRLKADVGLDNNADTVRGGTGSVTFTVFVDGIEKAKTPVCRVGEPAQLLDVDIAGAKEIEIRVDDAGDGISFDQADLAGIRLMRTDGSEYPLEEKLTSVARRGLFLDINSVPFRFWYGDRPSSELLSAETSYDASKAGADVARVTRSWMLSEGVKCTLEERAFFSFFGMGEEGLLIVGDYRLTFENTGNTPSAVLRDLDSLWIPALPCGPQTTLIKSRGGLSGDHGADLAFVIEHCVLNDQPDPVTMTVNGGRSSNGDLPFFQIHDATSNSGIFVGIGWSGQWEAQVGIDKTTGQLSLRAGMPGIHLRIPPGERIVTPRILIGGYRGDERKGANTLRRLLYTYYTPLLEGQKPLPPISFSTWFTMDNQISEERLLATAKAAEDLGIEYFCIDSGWFGKGFPEGVGNWEIDRAKFPNGFKPITEFVNGHGMKLGLWFEPERAEPGTQLAVEHPEWIHGHLVWLGAKETQDWIIDHLDRIISENNIEWIRYDFNTEPLPEWDKMDGPEERGLAQIRHIMGFYRVLDEIMARHSSLLIEGCASGGRRIDLETIARSHTFWKSDYTTGIPCLRFQVTGGNYFLPGNYLNVNLLFPAKPFEYHSLFGGPLGFGIKFAEMSPQQLDDIRKQIAQYREIRRYLIEDYYPLFEQSLDEKEWTGWQFHDPKDGSGIVIAVRPAASPYTGASVKLSGIDVSRRYKVTDIVADTSVDVEGRRLAEGYGIDADDCPGSRLLHYEPLSL